MSETFTFTRMRFSQTADGQLRTMASRTGLRPNVICRIALAHSLESFDNFEEGEVVEWSAREINRGTLFGEFEQEFLALLRQWKAGASSRVAMDNLCMLHIHRGIESLQRRSSKLRNISALHLRLSS